MKLVREIQHGVCTLGKLYHSVDGTLQGVQLICVTLELPWLNNQDNISCIPCGQYKVRYRFSTSHGKALYWIDDVPDRDAIEMHIGNTVADTQGCVLLGTAWGVDKIPTSISESKKAFDKFMSMMDSVPEFDLEIVHADMQ